MPTNTHTATYEFAYGDAGWSIRLVKVEKDSLPEFTRNLYLMGEEYEARYKFVAKAFEAASRMFFPHVSTKTAAWVQHKERVESYREHGIDSIIKRSRWPMDWYWISSFRALGGLDLNDHARQDYLKGYTFRIFQVRQWVMVCGYRENKGKQTLTYEPLFGRSERLHAWSQYWLYLPFFKDIESTYKKFENASELEKAMVLGRHDVVYEVTDCIPKGQGQEKSFEVTLKATLHLEPYHDTYPYHCLLTDKEAKTKRHGKREHVRSRTWDKDEPHIHLYQPYGLVKVPCFNNRETADSDKDNNGRLPLLLSSDHYCEALARMSEIWNDRTAKNLLLIAPSGSGKENLVSTVFNFRDYSEPPKSDKQRRLITTSLSPHDPDGNERQLFCAMGKIREHVHRSVKAHTEIDNHITLGFVLQALDGVLFLDEIDKIPVETRTTLLRLLENSSFAVPSTPVTMSIKKNRPFFAFAGSSERNAMFALEPRDFWTRISHVVEMRHPLDIEDEEMHALVLSEYFQMFWNKHVPKFFGHKTGTERVPFAKKEGSLPFDDFYDDIYRFFLAPGTVAFLADRFATEARRIAPKNQLSVRNIGAIVQRVGYELFEVLAHPKYYGSAFNAFRRSVISPDTESMKTAIEKAKCPWYILMETLLIPDQGRRKAIERLQGEGGRREEYLKTLINSTIIDTFYENIQEALNKLPCIEIQEELESFIEKAIRNVLPVSSGNNHD